MHNLIATTGRCPLKRFKSRPAFAAAAASLATALALWGCASLQLRNAAIDGNVPQVQALLAQGADVNAADPYRVTALQFATDQGDAKPYRDIARLLLAHGADINHRTSRA